MIYCNQNGCSEIATYRFTWPGKSEAGICEDHVMQARNLCGAMGFNVQFVRIHKRRSIGKAEIRATDILAQFFTDIGILGPHEHAREVIALILSNSLRIIADNRRGPNRCTGDNSHLPICGGFCGEMDT